MVKISALKEQETPNRIYDGTGPSRRLADLQPARPLITATRLVHSTNRVRNLAALILGGLGIALVGMTLLPWQQSARGTGRVVAFKPGERQQQILAPQKGVVAEVGPELVEGAFVEKGTFLLKIEPLAANQQTQLTSQINNLKRKIEIVKEKQKNYEAVVESLRDVREYAIRAGQQAVEAAKAKLESKRELVSGYQGKFDQAKSNLPRQEELNRKGIVPDKELEYIRADYADAEAKLKSAKQEVIEAVADVSSKEAELEQKRQDAQAKIDKAVSDVNTALSELQSIEKEISDLEQKSDTLDRGEILAPTDGYIHRLPVFAGGQTVKEGDYLLTFVPKTDNFGVELVVRGNDMPLVEPGDHVRLQFEGWPAIQFSGWPDMAYGTFGGEVALVDPTDDGTGKFRVMVRPAEGEEWPTTAALRQGVRVNGWVMLRTVPVGFEMWRQLNGFPPLPPEDMKDKGKDATKRPKLPK